MKLARKKKSNADQDSVKKVFDGNVTLNQTCDFESSCSQYKSVVQQVQIRKIENKGSKEFRNARDVSSTSTENTNSGTAETENDKKIDKEHSHSAEAGLKAATCKLCQSIIPDGELQEHMRACLQQRFSRTAVQVDESAEQDMPLQCEICLVDLSDLEAAARSTHVNNCIDEKIASVAASKDSQVLEECHLCGKKMPHLSPFFRSLHITRCADKIKLENDQLKAKESSKSKRQSKVLDCPMCGQKLRTQVSRKTHLKKCGQKFDIPPNIIMERVREQEEQHKSQLENESFHVKPLEKVKKTNPRSRNSGGPDTNVRPAQFVDDQIQLAMALSKSLHEEQQKMGLGCGDASISFQSTSASEGKGPCRQDLSKVEVVNPGRDAFSILMTPKDEPPPTKKRRRKKERDDSMPELLAVSKEELARKIADKMAAMILPKEDDKPVSCTPEMAETELPNKYKAVVPQDKNASVIMSLWNCSSLNDHKKCDRYYVKELMPPISPCKVEPGSKLKSLASIPGRGLDDSVMMVRSTHSREETSIKLKVRDKHLNETLIPSSQTAVVLAELADGDVTMATDCSPSAAEASGFLKEELINDPSADALPAKSSIDTLAFDFSCMVNNKLCSDLLIRTRESTVIHAHKFVFAARCFKLFQEVSQNKELDLEEFSQASVCSVLGFLYTGKLDLSNSFVPEVRALAQRWQILELTAILDSLKSTLQKERDALNESLDEADKTQDRDLNELLKQVWGSDDEDDAEDSDSSGGEDAEKDDDADKDNDADEDEDVAAAQEDTESIGTTDDVDQNTDGNVENSPIRKLSQMSDKDIVNILSPETADSEINFESDTEVSDSMLVEAEVNGSEGREGEKEEREINLCDMEVEDGSPKNPTCDEANDEKAEVSSGPIEEDHANPNRTLSEEADELESAFIDLGSSDGESETETLVSGYGEDNPSDAVLLSVTDQSYEEEENHSKNDVRQSTIATPSVAGISMEEVTPDLFGDSFVGSRSHPSASNTPVGIALRDDGDAKKQNEKNRSSFEVILFESDDEDAQALNRTEEYDMKAEGDNAAECDKADEMPNYDEDDSGCPNSLFYQKLEDTFSDSPIFSTQKSQSKSSVETAKVNLSSKFENDSSGPPASPVGDEGHKDIALNASTSVDTASTLSQKRKRQSDQIGSPLAKPSSPGASGSPVFKSRRVCTCTPKKSVRRISQEQNYAPIDLTLSDEEVAFRENDMDLSNVEAQDVVPRNDVTSEEVTKAADVSHLVEGGDDVQEVDVWEDFDDDGGFLGLEIPSEFNTTAQVSEPVGTPRGTRSQMTTSAQSPSNLSTTALDMTAIQTGTQTPLPARTTGSKTLQAQEDEYDPPTDMDTDVSALLNDSVLWDDENEPQFQDKNLQVKDNLETPVHAKRGKSSKKGPSIPSPFTPMPNYDEMRTPALKDQCKKFGIKPHPKKKMVKSLKHIYHELHQYETDTSFEEDGDQRCAPARSQPQVQPSSSQTVQDDDVGRGSDSSGESDEDENHIGKLAETFVEGSSNKDSGSEEGSPVKGRGRGRGKRGGRSQAASRNKRPPKLDAAELKEKLRAYIHADDKLHLKILHYEPLLFDEFSAELKLNGIHAKDAVIVQCLDELNIQFTTKSDDGKSKWRKGRRKASPKK